MNDAQTELLDRLRSRIVDAWKTDPLFIEPLIRSGLTKNQIASLEQAAKETAKTGIPFFIAVTPALPIPGRNDEGWGQFTSDLAFTMHERSGSEYTLVLFAEVEGAARTMAYFVDDNGPRIPPGSDQLQRSKSDDFLPLELAIPYHLRVLVAAAEGSDPPPLPDFDSIEAGERSDDYIEVTGLDNGNPDGIVFGATTIAAAGLTLWLMTRRERYAWRTALTTGPELVRRYGLEHKVAVIAEPVPEPKESNQQNWALHDRAKRIQEAVDLIVTEHPDWATSADFSHRHAILCLARTDKWVRKSMGRKGAAKGGGGFGTVAEEEPEFCYFFPSHVQGIESFAWKQKKTTLTVRVCEDCRADLNAGHEPVTLMVPKNPDSGRSRPVPYFQRDDAYATSGFGSFQPLEDAIVEARALSERGTR